MPERNKEAQRQIDIFLQRRENSAFPESKSAGIPTLAFIKHKMITRTLGIKSENRLLDVGCWRGEFAYWLTRKFTVNVIALDILEPLVKDALIYNEEKLKFCVADIEALPFKPELFDFIFCFDILEHVTHKNESLDSIYRVLKEKGRMLMHMPVTDNRFSFSYLLESIFPKTAKLLNERLGHFPGNALSLRQLKDLLSKAGFICEKIIYTDAFFVPMVDFLVGLLGNKIKNTPLFNKENDTIPPGHLLLKKIYFTTLLQFFRPLFYMDMLLSKLGIKSGVYIIAAKLR